jgi:tetratricopeptide (TPR) repeat protein
VWTIFVVTGLFTTLGCGPQSTLDQAGQAFVDAQQAIADGDQQRALELLGKSIESRPDPWAYYQRAKLLMESGQDEPARADIAAGLELQPDNNDLLWLQNQLKKPAANRFRGRDGTPPRATK